MVQPVMNPMRIGEHDVLIVVDVQRDFCPGGALAVPHGDEVIAPIHRIAPLFEHIVLTQDWHTPDHWSFASAHEGKRPFESIEASYGAQTLWPDHCVEGTRGAEFHPALQLTRAELVLRKGFRREIDSYSAFFENDRTTPTGLAGYLDERGLNRVFLAGLAYDYCVGYSALDARRLGLEAYVLRDACRAIDLGGSVAVMEAKFASAGVAVMETGDVLDAAALSDAQEGIRQGLADAEAGRTRPVREFFDEFEKRRGIRH
jgi:nicotinamidase/pyrazinamidase